MVCNATSQAQRVNRSSLAGRTRFKHYPSNKLLGYYHDVPFGTGPSLPLFALPVADMIVRKPQNDRCTFPEFAGDFGRAMMQPHNALYDR
jgi:hypothetical protein